MPHKLSWTLSVMLYTSLTLSTALQFTWGPEASLRLGGYYIASEASRPPEFRAAFPDFASLAHDSAASAALQPGEPWKFSTFWADAAYYVLQAKHPAASIAPYKYRFLPTWLVGVLSSLLHVSVETAFLFFNVTISIATALLFESYLRGTFQLARPLAMFGGALCITTASNVGTVAYPMLEPAAAFFSCLLFLTAANRNALGFACAAVAGVATKEILVFSALLWCLHRREAEPMWRSVDELAVRDESSGLSEPGRKPERANFAPCLVARSRPAIESVEGWCLQEQRAHRRLDFLRLA